jgi:hypothetical protein
LRRGQSPAGRGNTAIAQGFSDWIGLVGLRAAGYDEVAAQRFDKISATWRQFDPQGYTLNLAHPEQVATHEEACAAKWTCLLVELEVERGVVFFSRYVAALRQGLTLADANTKVVGPRPAPITFDDILQALNLAAGEDMRSWLKQFGVVSPQEWTFAGEKEEKPSESVSTSPALPPLSIETRSSSDSLWTEPQDWSDMTNRDRLRFQQEPWPRKEPVVRAPTVKPAPALLPENRPLDPRKGRNVAPIPHNRSGDTGTRESVSRFLLRTKTRHLRLYLYPPSFLLDPGRF